MNTSAVATEPAASLRGRFTPGEWMLLGVVALAFVHHLDHVLRADNSGWPFTSDLTPFTISLLVYPIFVLDFLLLRPAVGAGGVGGRSVRRPPGDPRHRRAARRPVRHLGQPEQFGSPRPWPAEPARHRLAGPRSPLGRRLQPAVTGRAGGLALQAREARTNQLQPAGGGRWWPPHHNHRVDPARRVVRGHRRRPAGAGRQPPPPGNPHRGPRRRRPHDRRQPALGPRSPGHRPRPDPHAGRPWSPSPTPSRTASLPPWPGSGPSPPSPASPSG